MATLPPGVRVRPAVTGPENVNICMRGAGRPTAWTCWRCCGRRPGIVLRLGAHRVALDAAAAEVVDLRVARGLVEARVVPVVVQPVDRVERVGDRGLRLVDGRQRFGRRVVDAIEAANRRDVGAEIGARGEPVGRRQIGVGVDVVAVGLGRVRREPRIGDARRRMVEPAHRHQIRWHERRECAVGIAGRMRADADLRAVERPPVARFGEHPIGELNRRIRPRILSLLADRQIAPFQHAAVGGGDDVAKCLRIRGISGAGVELGDVCRDQPSADREHDGPHGSGLGHEQARARSDLEPLFAAVGRHRVDAGGGNRRAQSFGQCGGQRLLARALESHLGGGRCARAAGNGDQLVVAAHEDLDLAAQDVETGETLAKLHDDVAGIECVDAERGSRIARPRA